jgi:hypothetical protein
MGEALLHLWACRSYVDMHLLSKGPAPKEAFAGKVVWITGASQVGDSCRMSQNTRVCSSVPA